MAFIIRWLKRLFGVSDSEESNEPTDSSDAVLTFNLTEITTSRTVLFQFTADEFEEFHECLCERNTQIYNEECTDISDDEDEDTYSDKYQCYLESSNDYSITCRRMLENETGMSGCRTYNRLESQESCHFTDTKITWREDFQLQDVSSNENVVLVNMCTSEDVSTTPLNLKSTATTPTETSPALEVTHQYSHPATIEDRNDTLATITPTASSNSSFRYFIDSDDIMQDEEGNTFVIIGVVLVLCVAVAVLVVLGVILWKRKRRSLTAGQDVRKSHEEYEMGRFDNPGGTGSGVENQAMEYSYADVNMEMVAGNDSNKDHQNSKVTNEELYTIVDSNYNQASRDRKVSDVSSLNTVYTYVDNSAGVTLQDIDGRAFHPQDGDDDGSYSVVTVSHNNASKGAYPGNYSLTQSPRGKVKDTDVKHNDTESISNGASKEVKKTPGLAGDEYSRLHQVQRQITNPYNLLPKTDPKNEYSRLHETQRHFQDPYNFLHGKQTSSSLDIV